MKGWWPSPSFQASDPRCAALSLHGRGLWWSLCDSANGRGFVPLRGMTLDAVLLAITGRAPSMDVHAAWEELIRMRLVTSDEIAITLCLPRCDQGPWDIPSGVAQACYVGSVESFVYALGTMDLDRVKIGYSRDPWERLRDLQQGCPDPLRILAVMPGGYKEEQGLHRLFGAYRLRANGEWFRTAPPVMAWCREWWIR